MFGLEGTKENQNKDGKYHVYYLETLLLMLHNLRNTLIMPFWKQNIQKLNGKIELIESQKSRGGLRQIESAGTVFNLKL